MIHHYLGVRLNGPRTGPLLPSAPPEAPSSQSDALSTTGGGRDPSWVLARVPQMTRGHPRLPCSVIHATGDRGLLTCSYPRSPVSRRPPGDTTRNHPRLPCSANLGLHHLRWWRSCPVTWSAPHADYLSPPCSINRAHLTSSRLATLCTLKFSYSLITLLLT